VFAKLAFFAKLVSATLQLVLAVQPVFTVLKQPHYHCHAFQELSATKLDFLM